MKKKKRSKNKKKATTVLKRKGIKEQKMMGRDNTETEGTTKQYKA